MSELPKAAENPLFGTNAESISVRTNYYYRQIFYCTKRKRYKIGEKIGYSFAAKKKQKKKKTPPKKGGKNSLEASARAGGVREKRTQPGSSRSGCFF
jgi:hypothetical protein